MSQAERDRMVSGVIIMVAAVAMGVFAAWESEWYYRYAMAVAVFYGGYVIAAPRAER